MISLDLAKSRQETEEALKRLDLEPALKREITPAAVESLREKAELYGFDTLLTMPETAKLPDAAELLRRAVATERHETAEFLGDLTPEALAAAKDNRPAGPYLLLTSLEATAWTKGLSPEKIRETMERLGEPGLTIREYLVLEQLQARRQTTAEMRRLDEHRTVWLMGSELADGRVIVASNTPLGRIHLGAAEPRQAHPHVAARTGFVIPL